MSKKNRLEEYIKALIEAEEAKMSVQLILLVGSVVLFLIVATVIIATTQNPFLAGAIISGVVIVVSGFAAKHFLKKQATAEQRRDLLHPTEGEEGLIVAIKKQISDTITGMFGNKFTGLKKTQDPDGRDVS